MGYDDDPAKLKQRATTLRDQARQARTLARTLGGYLDDAVSKATPRPGMGAEDLATGATPAIWTGPYADQCTQTLSRRQGTLRSMAEALMADANRWENTADKLDDQAKAKDKTGATAGGGR
ncbi:MAG: hypothetical protein HOY69_34470 [Streptomyces sp.]|nr:hypothetical protein [Streptomyces sp.]